MNPAPGELTVRHHQLHRQVSSWRTMPERQRIRKLFAMLDAQPMVRFPIARDRLDAPDAHGVYVIRDAKRQVVHVGRTLRGRAGLRQRLRNHLAAQSSFVLVHLRGDGKKLRDGFTFQYLEVPNDRDRALLEHYATAWHCPIHLGVGAARAAGRANPTRAKR